MLTYFLKRLGLSVVTIFLVACIVFFMTRILPGNLAMRYLGKGATPEQIVAWNADNGFDRPLLVQFGDWLGTTLRGDLGMSLQYETPVSEILMPAIGYSARLAALAFLIIVPVGIAGGVYGAMRRSTWIDRVITVGGLSAAVIPEFVWAVVLLLVFGVALPWFPVTAFPDSEAPGFFDSVYHLILPSIALLLVLFGYIARITRAGVIEALESDYVRTAIMKGLTRRRAVARHVLRNALLPTIAVVASQVPYLVGGLVSVEIVFAYPGFGSALLSAVGARDYSLLQSAVMVTSLVIVLFQLAADMLFAALNPRIRHKVAT